MSSAVTINGIPFDSMATQDPQGNTVYDRTALSSDVARYFASVLTNGVLKRFDEGLPNYLYVSRTGSYGLTVRKGSVCINGRIGWLDNDDSSLTVEPAGSSVRYDLVVAEMNANDSVRAFRLVVLKGSSTVPTPTQTTTLYQLPLARVTIPANGIAISAVNDVRVFSRCMAEPVGDSATDIIITDRVCNLLGITSGSNVDFGLEILNDNLNKAGKAKTVIPLYTNVQTLSPGQTISVRIPYQRSLTYEPPTKVVLQWQNSSYTTEGNKASSGICSMIVIEKIKTTGSGSVDNLMLTVFGTQQTKPSSSGSKETTFFMSYTRSGTSNTARECFDFTTQNSPYIWRCFPSTGLIKLDASITSSNKYYVDTFQMLNDAITFNISSPSSNTASVTLDINYSGVVY